MQSFQRGEHFDLACFSTVEKSSKYNKYFWKGVKYCCVT